MKRYYLFLAVLFFISCRSSEIVNSIPSTPPVYSVIYVIHGDANYLYHMADGQGLQADEHVLQQAKMVAEKAVHGEVFIFHQKPERKLLWLFPKKDRTFYYYRDGKLLLKKKYSPHSSKKSFVTESKLYHHYTHAVQSSKRRKIFLYFGHEVPVRSDHVYNYSRPNVPFDTPIFAQGVQSFLTPGDSPFNLIVLSTCNNGTPSMIEALRSYSRYILASPQNLHLSYIDTGQLSTLLERPQTGIAHIADSLATHTYQRLSAFLQTAITLSIYDTRKSKSYLPGLSRQYAAYLKNISGSNLLSDNTDCSKFSFFHVSEDTLGVQEWYKPPAFGKKSAHDNNYSGWGCK